MKWNEIGSVMGMNAVVYSLLFGILMALTVSTMRKKMIMRRGNSLVSTILVVVGIAGTISAGVIANLILLETALWLLLMFSASGFPMVVESLLSDHMHNLEKELLDD